MSDSSLTVIWLGVLVAGIGGCVIVHALGLAATYVRDMLHIGAAVWVFGWPCWHGEVWPIAIVVAAALATAALPVIAHRNQLAVRVVQSLTGGDERWTGLVHYTAMYAVFTAVGLAGDPFPAAAGLLALSFGDGIGGAVGRSFGRHHYQVSGAKRKSLEGSITVLLAAVAGAWLAAQLFDREVGILVLLVLGCVASVTEAVAPRSSDNLMIPLTVWTTATVLT
jgi:phytol kinase